MGYFETNNGWGTGSLRLFNSANYGAVEGSTLARELVGDVIIANGAGNVVGAFNCWSKTTNRFGSVMSDKKVLRDYDVSGSIAEEDEGYTHAGAIESLNASGEVAYWSWVAGKDGRPELFLFAEAAVAENYVVLFCDWDGTVLKQEQVAAGGAAAPPENPSRESFKFIGWSRDYSSVTENMIVYAKYGPLTYTFTFDSDGGTECEPQTYFYGDLVSLPTPTREGFEFVCWVENMTYKQFVTCPNYDPSLTALWREGQEPRARKLSVVQWNCKFSDAGKRATMIAAFADAITNSAPDVLILLGWENNAAVVTAFETAFPGYTFTTHGSNGSADGGARVIGYKAARFVQGEWYSIMSASNATTGYLPLREVGTDNYYVVFDMFSADTKGVSTYIGSLKSVYDNARIKYPTATFLAGGSYSAFTKDKDKEWSTKYNSDYTQALADLEEKTGLTALQAGEDLQWTLYSSAYDPCTIDGVSATKLENETVSANPGYLTTFKLGKTAGFMLIVR